MRVARSCLEAVEETRKRSLEPTWRAVELEHPPAGAPRLVPEHVDDLGRAHMGRVRLPERALQRGRQLSPPAAERRGDLRRAPAPVGGVDRTIAGTAERVLGGVLDPADRREQRGRRAEKAWLERRVEDVVAIAIRDRELCEGVDLGVREA